MANSLEYGAFFKRTIKQFLQYAIFLVGPHRFKRRHPTLTILTYHRVLPTDDPENELTQPGMVVSPELLDMHLGIVKRYFTVISLTSWIKKAMNNGSLPNNALVVTFDDGWRDTFEHAYPLLIKHQIPATVFLVSKKVGTDFGFWPEQLVRLFKALNNDQKPRWSSPDFDWMRALGIYSVPDTQDSADLAIQRVKKLPEAEIESQLQKNLSLLSEEPAKRWLMNWPEVQEMEQSGLVTFGSHTRTHRRLGFGLPRQVLFDEVVHSKAEIAEKVSGNVDTFCYPNGDFNEVSRNLVKNTYACGVTTRRGINKKGSDLSSLKRISLHSDIARTPVAFLARLSGWI